ncbi:MAG: hypothetical protein LBJ67_04855 [Planctomycetaceae bacterium]|nr:hypothetical protein [Planctomycetaceae bacterium]
MPCAVIQLPRVIIQLPCVDYPFSRGFIRQNGGIVTDFQRDCVYSQNAARDAA